MNKNKAFVLFTDGSAQNMAQAIDNPNLITGSFGYAITEFSIDDENYYRLDGKYRYSSGHIKGVMSPRAELLAVYHVLDTLKKHVIESKIPTRGLNVLLVSDSLNTVLTYNEWIWKWTIDPNNRNTIRKGSKTIKNSDIIHDTYFLLQDMIGELLMSVELVHLNSHIPKNKLGEAYTKFTNRSGMVISNDLFLEFVELNNLIDKLASDPKETIFNAWENDTLK